MGFKTTNYTVRKTMITLPEAYAVIKNIRIDGKNGVADFAIQTSRENSMLFQPVEVVKVFFEVDRNESPYVTAYKKAKEKKETLAINPETGKLEPTFEYGAFYDWADDIV